MTNTKDQVARLLRILDRDLDGTLYQADAYLHGRQRKPYVPDSATSEYRDLAERCITNWMDLAVRTPTQALYVDNFRPSRDVPEDEEIPELKHWQDSRLDERQLAIHRGAVAYGHSFTVTERKRGMVLTRGLSALRTSAIYDDPANDIDPIAALTVTDFPDEKGNPGYARLWDGSHVYEIQFLGLPGAREGIRVAKGVPHGSAVCPVTRFAAEVDLEGRTHGVIKRAIPLQDRINQTMFDLLVTQTYNSFKVRWATGMSPDLELEFSEEDGEWVTKLDEAGQPTPRPMQVNQSRWMFNDSPEGRFGTLDETPLEGFIASLDKQIRDFSAMTQTPPHFLLGQIANLSAEALEAAAQALNRRVDEFKHSFGESWERVFRLAGELAGEQGAAEDFAGEVVWRDVDAHSLSKIADGLGKAAEMLGIPREGLWHRMPNTTANEILEWKRLAREQDSELVYAEAISSAAAGFSGTRTSNVGEARAADAA